VQLRPGRPITTSLAATGALAVSLMAACAGPRQFTAEDRAGATAVLERQAAAWNRGDLDGYMRGYAATPDLVFTSGGRIRRGYEEARTRYQQRYGGDRSGMGNLEFEVLDVQAVGPDGAVVLGRWRLRDTPNAGSGVFSVVLERRPEGWRIIHDHTSSDQD
jgi:ketosteroid isomerase-like protein